MHCHPLPWSYAVVAVEEEQARRSSSLRGLRTVAVWYRAQQCFFRLPGVLHVGGIVQGIFTAGIRTCFEGASNHLVHSWGKMPRPKISLLSALLEDQNNTRR